MTAETWQLKPPRPAVHPFGFITSSFSKLFSASNQPNREPQLVSGGWTRRRWRVSKIQVSVYFRYGRLPIWRRTGNLLTIAWNDSTDASTTMTMSSFAIFGRVVFVSTVMHSCGYTHFCELILLVRYIIFLRFSLKHNNDTVVLHFVHGTILFFLPY